MAAFSPHGDHRLEIHDHLLVVRVSEPSNREELERILRLIFQGIDGFGGEAWGLMLVFERLFLMTPDAESLTHQAHIDFAKSGMKAFAMVMSERPSRPITVAMVKRIHGDVPCPIQVFDSESEALAWLAPLVESTAPGLA